mgnify:FL=1
MGTATFNPVRSHLVFGFGNYVVRLDRYLGAVLSGGLIVLTCAALLLSDWWIAGLLGQFHVQFIAAGIVLSLILIRFRCWFAASASFLAVAINALLLLAYVPPSPAAHPFAVSAQTETLRVMTFNVLFSNRELAPLRRAIETHQPDIVLLQEVNAQWNAKLDELTDIMPYQLQSAVNGRLPAQHGTAMLSRLPIEHGMRGSLAGLPGRLTNAEVKMPSGQPVGIAVTHLVKPTNYYGAALQRRQFDALADWLRLVDGPVLLTGDFNSTLYSADMRQFLKRSQMVTEQPVLSLWDELAGSYPAWLPFLGIKIDHVMGRDLSIDTARVVAIDGSDHRAIVADIEVNVPIQ